MKLQELFESDDSSKLSAVLKKASKAIDLARKGHILWRGHDGERDVSKFGTEIGSIDDDSVVFFLVKGRQKPRISLTGNSAMMKLTTSMPEWEDLPRRDRSTFATNNSYKAANFGQIGVVLPLNTVDKFATIRNDFNLKPVPTPGGKSVALHELSYEVGGVLNAADDIFSKCAKFVREPTLFSDVAQEDHAALIETIKKFRLADINLLGMTGGSYLLRDTDSEIKENIVNLGNYLTAVFKAMDESRLFKAFIGKGGLRASLVDFQNYCNIHEKNLYDELEEVLSPDNMGISLFRDQASAMNDMGHEKTSELWFEGDYILIVGDGTHNLGHVLIDMPEFKALL